MMPTRLRLVALLVILVASPLASLPQHRKPASGTNNQIAVYLHQAQRLEEDHPHVSSEKVQQVLTLTSDVTINVIREELGSELRGLVKEAVVSAALNLLHIGWIQKAWNIARSAHSLQETNYNWDAAVITAELTSAYMAENQGKEQLRQLIRASIELVKFFKNTGQMTDFFSADPSTNTDPNPGGESAESSPSDATTSDASEVRESIPKIRMAFLLGMVYWNAGCFENLFELSNDRRQELVVALNDAQLIPNNIFGAFNYNLLTSHSSCALVADEFPPRLPDVLDEL